MFSHRTDTEKVSPPVTLSELIPLSHLALDLEVPVEGWAMFLGRKGIAIVPDSLGRDSVGHDAARRLLDEKREHELRVRALRAVQEREADQRLRASWGRGVPADLVPAGSTYLEAAVAAELDAVGYHPRASVAADLLDNGGGGLTFHSLGPVSDGE